MAAGSAHGAPGGGTRLVGIIGSPVAGSLSPPMQNAAFAAGGLDWLYVAADVAPGRVPAAIAGARALGFVGLNVTAPHKAAAAGCVDRLVGDAAVCGMVNTVVYAGRETVGHSTDGGGFLDSARDHGRPCGPATRAVVVGAGGAGISVAAALLGSGARVTVLNRSLARLDAARERLATALPIDRLTGLPFDDRRSAALLAEATLVVYGLPPTAPVPALAWERLAPGAGITDLSYAATGTPFLQHLLPTAGGAASDPPRVWDGLGMLVHQGARSFALWTGRPAPLEVMARAVGYTRLVPRQDTGR